MGEHAVYGTGTALRIGGVTARQLDYWVQRGLVVPGRTSATKRPNRCYTFRDLVLIRTIAHLRDCGVSVEEIRLIAQQLRAEETDLAKEWLVVSGETVYRYGSEGELAGLGRQRGQLAFMVVVLHEVAGEVRGALEAGPPAARETG